MFSTIGRSGSDRRFCRRCKGNRQSLREPRSSRRLAAEPGGPLAKAYRSSDDVGRDLVFDEGDPIAQQQLAFFQPLQPQEIWRGRLMQRINRRVEVAVFLLQACEFCVQLALVWIGHDLY